MSGCQYFISLIDESTGLIKIVFINTKNEMLNIFKKVVQESKAETGNRVQVLRTDQRIEFTGKFKKFLLETGIKYKVSVPLLSLADSNIEREGKGHNSGARHSECIQGI